MFVTCPVVLDARTDLVTDGEHPGARDENAVGRDLPLRSQVYCLFASSEIEMRPSVYTHEVLGIRHIFLLAPLPLSPERPSRLERHTDTHPPRQREPHLNPTPSALQPPHSPPVPPTTRLAASPSPGRRQHGHPWRIQHVMSLQSTAIADPALVAATPTSPRRRLAPLAICGGRSRGTSASSR